MSGAAHRPRWDRFKTLAEAEATAAEARRSAAKEKSASAETAPKPVRKLHHKGKNASAETAPRANVGKRTTIYISDGGASGAEKADLCPNPPAIAGRFRCRRAGALSFERWGQVKPELVPAKRPRRAGGLPQARWHNAAGAAPNSRLPIVIEAPPSNQGLPSNAQHAGSRRLTIDVSTPHSPTAPLVH